jgi:hypothetical protein
MDECKGGSMCRGGTKCRGASMCRVASECGDYMGHVRVERDSLTCTPVLVYMSARPGESVSLGQ